MKSRPAGTWWMRKTRPCPIPDFLPGDGSPDLQSRYFNPNVLSAFSPMAGNPNPRFGVSWRTVASTKTPKAGRRSALITRRAAESVRNGRYRPADCCARSGRHE